MKSRSFPAMIVAVVLALLLGGVAGAAFRVPYHSVGYNKLSPGVQEMLKATAQHGDRGPAGPVGAPGEAGQQGAAGDENLFGYSALVKGGEEVLRTVGPLTFTGSCKAEGEDTRTGELVVSTSEDGVEVNGTTLDAGESLVLRKLSRSGGGSTEDFLPLIRAVAPSGFSLVGVSVMRVDFFDGCRFMGVLVLV